MAINPLSKKLIEFSKKFLANQSNYDFMVELISYRHQQFFKQDRRKIINLVVKKQRKAAKIYGSPKYTKTKIKIEQSEEMIDDIGWFLVEKFNETL